MIAVFRFALWLAVPVAFAQPPASPQSSPFVSISPAPNDELRFRAPFPEFEAKDISGRTWRTDDLRGRFTLILIWHTFGARAADKISKHPGGRFAGLPDLPELQRFYDKAKNSRNIQVLTFCHDYDYTHAPDYMKEKQYTFPVIADWVLIDKLFPSTEQEWVVNPEGRLSYPFRSWTFGRLLFEVEIAAAKN
jgi:hypothetical protein